MEQIKIFEYKPEKNSYRNILTVNENNKGVLDVDTVKGCSLGMKAHPGGGCYGECYANKIAKRYGIEFQKEVNRELTNINFKSVLKKVYAYHANWYRIGTFGDPSHDWEHTVKVIEQLAITKKIPVIITKHWRILSDEQIERLKNVSAIINTSISALDTEKELKIRIRQGERFKRVGLKHIYRVVSCKFGSTENGIKMGKVQNELFKLGMIIDNPLRTSKSNPMVINGDILIEERKEAIGGEKYISLNNADTYLGHCSACPDQCGVEVFN